MWCRLASPKLCEEDIHQSTAKKCPKKYVTILDQSEGKDCKNLNEEHILEI